MPRGPLFGTAHYSTIMIYVFSYSLLFYLWCNGYRQLATEDSSRYCPVREL